MAVFTATAGTAFDATNFGTFQGFGGEGSGVQQIDGALNWVDTNYNSLRLFQTLWYDDDNDGTLRPADGDYQMGRVDYAVILPVPVIPDGDSTVTVEYAGATRASFIDLISGQNVGTLTDANYDIFITATRTDFGVVYAVGEFNPIYSLFKGDDQVTLGDQSDNFYDPSGALLIDLGGGDDTLRADGYGADTVHGGAGHDLITYTGGGHQIFADDGNDVVANFIAGVNDTMPVTLTGGAGDDSLQGWFGDDVFIEGAGSGDDVLDGNFGIDTIDYSGASSAILVTMEVFSGRLAAPDYYEGTATGGSGTDYFLGIENVTGSAYADTLLGDSRGNVLLGNAGNDVLSGGYGADTMDGGVGRDQADYAGTYYGVTVNLTTGTGARNDAQGDVLTGFENVRGGRGKDKLIGDAGANVLEGGVDGRDTLIGMDGNDHLSGFARADRLSSGGGNDWLTGGAGADVLEGGVGNDHFVFASVSDSLMALRDVILDFAQVAGDRDRIDLRGVDAIAATEIDDAFVLTARHGAGQFTGVAGELRLVLTQGGTVVRMDVDGDRVSDMEILVQGIQTLTGHDFLL